jgi:serine/threonine-protein kinase
VGTLSVKKEDRFVGRTLPGGYHILDLISVGGMGRVYRAEQSVLGRTVAVKIIHPHLLADENSALRFMTEARAASQLNHPNSVAVFDFGRTDEGEPYLVMEFLRGKDLARVAYEDGPLSFERIVDVLRQVLAALGEAHDLGIIHRDLKPENVILEPLRRGGDFVKVVDFGLAKLKADAQAPSVTSPGIVCGTPDYMAPEQGRGDAIDGRSDLYAVGVILFQLLTSQLPFEAENPTQVVMMHMTLPVPDPRELAPERNIPDELVAVAYKALEKDARRRFQDAHEFSGALAEALAALSMPPADRVSALPGMLSGALTVTCPACGVMVASGKFCSECGERLRGRSSSASGQAQPKLPLPLVGREDDLAWLEERLAASSRTVTGARIVGEPGSGKTRLLLAFTEQARALGARVVLSGPDCYFAQAAYYGLRHAICELAELEQPDIAAGLYPEASPEARRGLEEIFRGAPNRNDRRKPIERRHAVADALRWAIERASRLSRQATVVVAIDDLDRVDSASRHAFADVMGELPSCPALLVGAHAPGFEPGWGAGRVAARVLSMLPLDAVAKLLEPHVLPEQLQALREEGGKRGILPMQAEELLRHSLDGGTDAPSRLADLIGARVARLDPEARRALQALVVIGDNTSAESVLELLPKSSAVEKNLQQLSAAGLVVTSSGRYSIAHPLTRDIVLGGIPVAVRRELHERALRLHERLETPTEARALHAYHAQDSFQALLLLEQVAARAELRDDYESEVLALRRALEIARQEISRGELDDPLRAVLIFGRKLGSALTRAGQHADAEGVLREALDIAGPSGTDRAQVLQALAHVAHGRRRSAEALTYIDQAIEAARKSGARDLLSALSDTRRAWAS